MIQRGPDQKWHNKTFYGILPGDHRVVVRFLQMMTITTEVCVDVDEFLFFNERSNQLMYTFKSMRLMFYKQQSDFWTVYMADVRDYFASRIVPKHLTQK